MPNKTVEARATKQLAPPTRRMVNQDDMARVPNAEEEEEQRAGGGILFLVRLFPYLRYVIDQVRLEAMNRRARDNDQRVRTLDELVQMNPDLGETFESEISAKLSQVLQAYRATDGGAFVNEDPTVHIEHGFKEEKFWSLKKAASLITLFLMALDQQNFSTTGLFQMARQTLLTTLTGTENPGWLSGFSLAGSTSKTVTVVFPDESPGARSFTVALVSLSIESRKREGYLYDDCQATSRYYIVSRKFVNYQAALNFIHHHRASDDS